MDLQQLDLAQLRDAKLIMDVFIQSLGVVLGLGIAAYIIGGVAVGLISQDKSNAGGSVVWPR